MGCSICHVLKEEAVVPDLELLGVSSGSFALRRQFVHTDAKVVHDDLGISTRQRFKEGIVNEHVLFLKRAKHRIALCAAALLFLGLGLLLVCLAHCFFNQNCEILGELLLQPISG